MCVCVCVFVWRPGETVSESTRWFMAGQRTMLQWDLSVEGSLTFQHLQVTEKDRRTAQTHTQTHTHRGPKAIWTCTQVYAVCIDRSQNNCSMQTHAKKQKCKCILDK